MSKQEIYLTAEGIEKNFFLEKVAVPVLKSLDLTVYKGEWLALLGASGSGKTTLLNILGLLEKPDFGSILIDGEDLINLSKRAAACFRRQRFGFIFQAYHLLPELTVLENVKLAGMINFSFGKELTDKAHDLLDKVGLSHRKKHRPNELSGGEQQRVAIARSLINSPELILADEPTGNLDSNTGKDVLKIFETIHDSNRTIIMVTHNHEIANLADRIIHLQDGVIKS